jgi:ABC-type multidrug transport system ATPase subunit
VSDTVAILNRGELIAQAPIEELLSGSGGITYQLKLRGVVEKTRMQIQNQPWVVSISERPFNGYVSWSITVSDEAAAEDQLLRLLLSDPVVTVADFGRQKYELEEVFLKIIEGSEHVK